MTWLLSRLISATFSSFALVATSALSKIIVSINSQDDSTYKSQIQLKLIKFAVDIVVSSSQISPVVDMSRQKILFYNHECASQLKHTT